MTSSNFEKHTTKNPIQRFLINRYFSKLKKLFPKNINNVLDVGCGEGFLLRYLPPIQSYVGIDTNESSLYIAENSKSQIANLKKIQNIKFQKEDVYHLSFENGSFDLVTCLEVLEHLETPEKALSEIKRITKKWVILSVPHEPWFQLSNFLRGKYFSTLGNHPEHINKWNPSHFRQLIAKYFTIKKEAFSFAWQIYLCEKK